MTHTKLLVRSRSRSFGSLLKSSPRPISAGQLHTLLCFHTQPIYLVFFKGSYFLIGMRYFISGRASRLDAFSVYPFRTQLPSHALGRTTGTPLVRPLRSSRTRSSLPHVSCARDGYGPNCLTTSEPSSRTTLMGEQPNPWDLLQPPGCDEPTSRCQTTPSI